MPFANRLISLANPGEKKYQFARRLNMRPQYLSRYLRGMMPGPPVVTRICEATGVAPKWLLLGEGPKYGPAVIDPQTMAKAYGPNGLPGPEHSEKAVHAGQSTTRTLTDQDQAELAISHILDTTLPINDRETLADLIREAVDNQTARSQILDHYRFLIFQKRKR